MPSGCPVGSVAAWWGEAAVPLSPQSLVPLPSPPCSAPPAQAAAGRTLEAGDGDGIGAGGAWRRGPARCTPGTVVQDSEEGGEAGEGGAQTLTELLTLCPTQPLWLLTAAFQAGRQRTLPPSLMERAGEQGSRVFPRFHAQSGLLHSFSTSHPGPPPRPLQLSVDSQTLSDVAATFCFHSSTLHSFIRFNSH